jgi:hypothetical protein
MPVEYQDSALFQGRGPSVGTRGRHGLFSPSEPLYSVLGPHNAFLSCLTGGLETLEDLQRAGVICGQREGRIRFADRVEAHLCWTNLSTTSFSP